MKVIWFSITEVDKMRTAVIGIGAIGPIHIKGLLENGAQIVALCDIKKEKCEKANRDFGISANIYEDYITMLDREQPDVVHICTPHYLHAPMICECLGRGIHVLSEKPLAISEAQLNQIEQAAKHTKGQLGVCFQNRFNAATVYVKNLFKDQKIISAGATMMWNRDKAYYDQDAWRGTKEFEGGGVMINQAIHSLDMLIYLCGMPQSVVAHTHNISLQNVIEVEDTAMGVFTLADGAKFSISATNALNRSFPPYFMYRGERDTVMMTGDHIIVNDNFVTASDGKALFGKSVWGVGHAKLIKEYYRCVESGEQFPIDFEEGAKAIRAILAMYRSNGQEVLI